MVGVEGDTARGGERLARCQIFRPALQDGRPCNRSAQGAAHPLPLDRRAGVKEHALLQTRYHIARRAHVHQDGLRFGDAGERLGIRVRDHAHPVPSRQVVSETFSTTTRPPFTTNRFSGWSMRTSSKFIESRTTKSAAQPGLKP